MGEVEPIDERIARIKGLHILPWGVIDHPNGPIEVTAQMADELIAAFAHFSAQGYYPPVLMEHKLDGDTYGLIESVYTGDEGVFVDMQVTVEAAERYEKGELVHRSPAILRSFSDPMTGEEFGHVLREVSWVAVPHLKNLSLEGTPYQLGEDTESLELLITTHHQTMETVMAKEGYEEDDDMKGDDYDMTDVMSTVEALAGQVSSMTERFDAIEERLGEIEKSPAEMNEEGDGDSHEVSDDVESMIKNLQNANQVLREKLTAVESARMGERLARELGEDTDSAVVQRLTALSGGDYDQIKDLVSAFSEKKKEVEAAKKSSTANDTTEVGSTGVAGGGSRQKSASVTYGEAVEMGEAEGIKNGSKEMAEYLEENHPQVLSEKF